MLQCVLVWNVAYAMFMCMCMLMYTCKCVLDVCGYDSTVVIDGLFGAACWNVWLDWSCVVYTCEYWFNTALSNISLTKL